MVSLPGAFDFERSLQTKRVRVLARKLAEKGENRAAPSAPHRARSRAREIGGAACICPEIFMLPTAAEGVRESGVRLTSDTTKTTRGTEKKVKKKRASCFRSTRDANEEEDVRKT